MTISFVLKTNNKSVVLFNPDFNPSLEEDVVFNPRYIDFSIYPEVNVTASNAQKLFYYLDINKNIDYGELHYNELDEICTNCTKILNIYLKTPNIDDEQRYLYSLVSRFDKLVRYAIALNDSIVWC